MTFALRNFSFDLNMSLNYKKQFKEKINYKNM